MADTWFLAPFLLKAVLSKYKIPSTKSKLESGNFFHIKIDNVYIEAKMSAKTYKLS